MGNARRAPGSLTTPHLRSPAHGGTLTAATSAVVHSLRQAGSTGPGLRTLRPVEQALSSSNSLGPTHPSPGMHQKGRDLRGGPRGG